MDSLLALSPQVASILAHGVVDKGRAKTLPGTCRALFSDSGTCLRPNQGCLLAHFYPSYVQVLKPWYFELECSPPGKISLQPPMVLCHGEATHIGKAFPTKVTETWRGWSHMEPEGESSREVIPYSSLSLFHMCVCVCVCVYVSPAHLCWANACK